MPSPVEISASKENGEALEVPLDDTFFALPIEPSKRIIYVRMSQRLFLLWLIERFFFSYCLLRALREIKSRNQCFADRRYR